MTSGRPCHHTWQAGRTTATAIGLGAKFVIALIPVLLTVLACLLAGGALTAILSLPLHGTIYADRVNYGELALGTLRTAYIILLYVALSFMLAVLTRSTAAVTGSLIFLLVIETVLNVALPILGKPSAQIAQYLPTNLATVIGNQNAAIAKLPIPAASALAPSLWVAAIGLACYTLLFCFTGRRAIIWCHVYCNRRRDISYIEYNDISHCFRE